MIRKSISKSPRTKSKRKGQKEPAKKLININKEMWWGLISITITILVAIIFYKLGVSKKDIKQGVAEVKTQVKQEVSQLRQDLLKNNDYKKYLEIYEILYRSILKASFPGGYTTLGLRDGSIFNPGTFSNENIQVDVEGTVSFKGKNCSINIFNKRIYFAETQNSISNIEFKVNIENYELGRLYSANNIVTAVGWKQYIVILSDDIVNPVFVFGFAKL